MTSRDRAAWVLALLMSVSASGCGGQPATTGGSGDAAPTPPSELAAIPCPEAPDEWVNLQTPVWPAEAAADLVPVLDGLCALPAAPALFGLIDEVSGMNPELEAAALGVLHDGQHLVATFEVAQLRAGSAFFDDGIRGQLGDGAFQEGEIVGGWFRRGDAVFLLLIAEPHAITLIGESAEGLTGVADAWMAALGEDVSTSVPASIPQMPMSPDVSDSDETVLSVLEEGLPVDGLPDGFTYLELAPMLMANSDLIDSVAIFDDDVAALGAGLVLNGDQLVGTAIGWDAMIEGVGTTPAEIVDLVRQSAEGHEAELIRDGRVEIAIVGYDSQVEDLAEAWNRASGD